MTFAQIPYTRIAIDDVIAAFPVQFAIIQNEQDLFIAYYNTNHDLIVKQRPLTGGPWISHQLPVSIGWDSHNYITMQFDSKGHIHLSANMHVDPLVYFISDKPNDISSWTQQQSLIGKQEDRCTYPQFLHDHDGHLVFHYRDGSSGDGCDIYNIYNAETQTWQRLLDQALLDGSPDMNAYAEGPIMGSDGHYHLCWVWRDNPAADSNHDLSYASSPDLKQWFAADGTALSLPITIADTACIVDNCPVQGGLINGNNHIGFDADNRPLLIYHKYNAAGHSEIFCARFIDNTWHKQQISDWQYRWQFGGWGSIEFEIRLQRPIAIANTLHIPYKHTQRGHGLLRIHRQNLDTYDDQHPADLYPNTVFETQSDVPLMRPNLAGTYPSRYLLQWDSLPNNRDQKPEAHANLSSTLYLITFDQDHA